MRTGRTLILTTLAAAGLTAVLCSPASPGGAILAPAFAQQKPTPEELAADFEKELQTKTRESAKTYESLYKWCWDKKLSYTAINVRRLVLRYDPENEEVRKFVGYAKTPDGQWIRNEARRDAIREEADIEDPKAQKFPEKMISTDKKVAGMWKALAQKAKKNGELDPANAATWTTKSAECWERVLQIDSTNEEAHKSLGHPKFAGKYVRPEAVPYLKTRAERKEGGQKRAQLGFPTQPVEVDGVFKGGGLTGAGAKSDHYLVNTVHGKDVAARLATWAERSLKDFIEVYGTAEDIKDRLPWNRYDIVKDKEEMKRMSQSGGWDAARIEQYAKYFGGWGIVPGERASMNSAGMDADDHIIHYNGHALVVAMRNMAVQDVGQPNEGIEDWLFESLAYDITRRLTGTTVTTCGAFGKYGMDMEPNPAKDIWIELAKRQVEYDDDVPLTRLWKCSHEKQDLKGPETVKGYAFIQFLFESDVEKARKFCWIASAQGTPRAVLAVYSEGDAGGGTQDNPAYGAMEKLDAKYREWILKSW
jgi:hypothetical protein